MDRPSEVVVRTISPGQFSVLTPGCPWLSGQLVLLIGLESDGIRGSQDCVSDPVEVRRHVYGTKGTDYPRGTAPWTCRSTGRGDAGAAWPRVARLPADDEGLDVVPAIAVGGLRDALLELSEEGGEETGSVCLALAREGTE